MDVSDRDGWRRLADRVRTELGSVDTLCLNAGVTTAGPLVGHSFEEWTWVYDTVLWGIVHGIEAFVPAMTAAGRGRVLITGSLAGLVPDMFLGHGPYVSAKAAVTALALGLRAELAPQGVGVSVLIPGPTATGLPAAVRPAAATVTDGIAPDPMGLIRPRSDLPAPLTGAPDWLESEDVAERALDGLRRNEAFIATHPHMRPVVDEYLGRVQAAFTHTAVTTTAIDAPL
jgi:NAD(P)-dependent dehydrogenase (short-subunit alcohol dehydrogenase family)